MKIGIIGTGNIGGALTRRFRSVGHEVRVANSRGPSSLTEFAQETGAHPVSVEQAAQENDLVVVTIPFGGIRQLPAGLFAGAPDDLVIIDTNNYYPRERDGYISEVEEGLAESRWVERQLGHSVVKAFNNIMAQHLLENGKPAGSPGRIALPVAGDNVNAKAVVMRLVEEIGFDAVDAGTIEESWRQQPGSPVYIKDFDPDGVRRALAQARPERPMGFRATPRSPGTYESPA